MKTKVCEKCGDSFPFKIFVGERAVNGRRRKYCLKCSPFWRRNTDLFSFPPLLVTCGCGRVYTYERKKRGGHTRTKCNSCISNYKRAEKKRLAVEYKGGACQQCGYSKCIRALHFHHRDRITKNFEIGQDMCRQWELIKAELDKCDLLCSNCHAEEESFIADSSSSRMPA